MCRGNNMYCTNCGKKLNDDFKICPYCGTKCFDISLDKSYIDKLNTTNIEKTDYSSIFTNVNYKKNKTNINDNVEISCKIICFFIPIVGLILYILWMNERPNSAQKIGLSALLGLFFQIILIICFCLGVIFFIF